MHQLAMAIIQSPKIYWNDADCSDFAGSVPSLAARNNEDETTFPSRVQCSDYVTRRAAINRSLSRSSNFRYLSIESSDSSISTDEDASALSLSPSRAPRSEMSIPKLNLTARRHEDRTEGDKRRRRNYEPKEGSKRCSREHKTFPKEKSLGELWRYWSANIREVTWA